MNMSEFLIWVTAFLSWMPPLSFLTMSENIKLLFGDSLIKLQQRKGILNYLQNWHVLALIACCLGWPTDRLTSCLISTCWRTSAVHKASVSAFLLQFLKNATSAHLYLELLCNSTSQMSHAMILVFSSEWHWNPLCETKAFNFLKADFCSRLNSMICGDSPKKIVISADLSIFKMGSSSEMTNERKVSPAHRNQTFLGST